MKKRGIFLIGVGLLVFGIGIIIYFLKFDTSRKITFDECDKAGGEAWRVDLYHPDICQTCAEYRACENEASNNSSDSLDICPQMISCTECLKENFPYPDRCPEGKEKIGEISDAAIWFQCCK